MEALILLIPVILPILIGIVNLFIPDKKDRFRNILNIAAAVVGLCIIAVLFVFGCSDRLIIFRFSEKLVFSLNADRLGLLFSGLVSVLWPFCLLYAFEYMEKKERRSSFFAFYMMTLGCVVGIAFADNLFSLYIFYELLTLSTFPLVMHVMDKQAMEAGMNYLCYMLGGAAFAFVGMMFILQYAGTLDFKFGGLLSFADPRNKNLLILFFVITFLGFSVKAAMLPFSKWLIKASIAHMPVTALLHAVAVVKAGAFACIRLIYYVFGCDYLRGTWGQDIVLILTAATIIYGSSMAVKEQHLKRRLAYSTISNLSYILFGACLMTPVGMQASLVHLVAHAITKIGMFYSVGAIMHDTGKQYLYEIDGLGKRMKLLFASFTLSSLSLIGIPQFIGFMGKIKLITAALDASSVLAYVGAFAIIISALLTAIYLLSIIIRAYFPENGKVCEGFESCKDPGWRMLTPIMIFSVVSLVAGICWEPLISFINTIGLM